ncbi:hypothetical protein Bbelb_013080 [Branchiostoma belcheri]|nr:hypothetical protein Bbelb_013080 [Branchiostoma belcheri]
MWRNGRAFGSEPRGPGFEPCHVTDLVPYGKALYTTFLDEGQAKPISYSAATKRQQNLQLVENDCLETKEAKRSKDQKVINMLSNGGEAFPKGTTSSYGEYRTRDLFVLSPTL